MPTLLPLGQAQNETNGKSETGEMFLLGRHTIQQRRTGSQINTHKLQYLSYEVSIASRKKMTVINYSPLLRCSIHNHYVKEYLDFPRSTFTECLFASSNTHFLTFAPVFDKQATHRAFILAVDETTV